MKSQLKWILFCTGACMIAGAVSAQEYGHSSTPGTTTSSEQRSHMQSTGTTDQYFHAKDLVGEEAKDGQGNRLGKIEDIIFNPQKNETFAAIGVSGGRWALVPWQALTVSSTGTRGKEQVTLNTTKDALQSGPTITKNEWQSLNDPSFTQKVYSHYNVQAPAAMGGTSEGTSSSTSSGSAAGSANPTERTPQKY